MSTDIEATDSDTEQHHESSPLLPQSSPQAPAPALHWNSLAAAAVLLVLAILLMVGFVAPVVAHIYASEALDLDICNVAVKSINEHGIVLAIRSRIYVDTAKVHSTLIRVLGSLATATFVRSASIKPTTLSVHLHTNDSFLGSVTVPALSLKTKNRYEQFIQFESVVSLGDGHSTRSLAIDVLEGRTKKLDVDIFADVHIKAGILPYRRFALSNHFVTRNSNLPRIPEHHVERISITDSSKHAGEIEFAAWASIENPLPLTIAVPLLTFNTLIPECDPDKTIKVANAFIHPLQVSSESKVHLKIQGQINDLPEVLTFPCKGTGISPIDHYLSSYLSGESISWLVQLEKNGDLPLWLNTILQDLVVPIPIPGKKMEDLIHSISLTGVKIRLPSLTLPGDAQPPLLSGVVEAIINTPEGVNLALDIDRVRPDVLLYDQQTAFARISCEEWSHATMKPGKRGYRRLVADMSDIPIEILDKPTFERFLRRILFEPTDRFETFIQGTADVHIVTGLADFLVRKIPFQGMAGIKGFASFFRDLDAGVKSLRIVDSSGDSLAIDALVAIKNPTDYSFSISYLDVHFVTKGAVIGNGTLMDVEVRPGRNVYSVKAQWAPHAHGGPDAVHKSLELLSSYISGHNESIALRFHRDSIPLMPNLSNAISSYEISVPMPKLLNQDEPFVDSATFHLLTSSATFGFHNPFQTTPIMIKEIDGTAYYNGSITGTMQYDLPFAIDPGTISESPKLPVKWASDSIGYRAIRDALGGTLKLDGQAVVNISIGKFSLQLNITAASIDSHIRIF
ncbi:hypothetical protein NEOLI_000755 [Neolecta irregularis DAH-3]|uniref:Pre-rRNA processing protein n=1 Tax=Neolecta irregularis (strain DAH-3) TaxID=1198029 RepID=A0A1U7LJ24_NEOID|nr:hypothetical protein NEOLI_000755 [Neolecta irregularis DAH-3]|eukprot:OLL22552.1 hypothetical protein NEOLI_000755 [Neolecta irregularis DAH-3]